MPPSQFKARLSSAGHSPWACTVLFFFLLLGCQPAKVPAPVSASPPPTPVRVLCAASLREPLEAIAKSFEAETKIPVTLEFGGSQILLAQIRLALEGKGEPADLFLPADDSYLKQEPIPALTAATFPLVKMKPVLVVAKGNPQQVASLADLLEKKLKLSLADPKTAAIGKLLQAGLAKDDVWNRLSQQATVTHSNVSEVAGDLKLAAVDAGFIWDSMLSQLPAAEVVPLPELEPIVAQVSLCLLKQSETSPSTVSAQAFAQYVANPKHGLAEFRRRGFRLELTAP